MPSLLDSSPRTLGALRQSSYSEERLAGRSVKDELRANLICRLRTGDTLFSPGVVGYEDNRHTTKSSTHFLSRHNFILLGTARTGEKRGSSGLLTTLLDDAVPYIAGCEIHDNPYTPILQTVPRIDRGDEK